MAIDASWFVHKQRIHVDLQIPTIANFIHQTVANAYEVLQAPTRNFKIYGTTP